MPKFQNIIKKVSGQKFVYKFVQFPENFDVADIKVVTPNKHHQDSTSGGSTSPPVTTTSSPSSRSKCVQPFGSVNHTVNPFIASEQATSFFPTTGRQLPTKRSTLGELERKTSIVEIETTF